MQNIFLILLLVISHHDSYFQDKYLLSDVQQTKPKEGMIVFRLDKQNGICTSELNNYDSILIAFKEDKVFWECNRTVPIVDENGERLRENKETNFMLRSNSTICRWEMPQSEEKEPYTCYTPKQAKQETVKLILTKETKVIAGFLCKKAFIQHKASDIKGQNSAIQWIIEMEKTMPEEKRSNLKLLPIPYQTAVYYTDQLPKHISIFQYANLNGCILEHTGVDGLHIKAERIELSSQNDSLFSLPKK